MKNFKKSEKLSKLPDTMKIIHIKDGEPSKIILRYKCSFIKLPVQNILWMN